MSRVSYDDVQDSLDHETKQRESVKGKETPYRTVFKVKEKLGSVSYFYHETIEQANNFDYEGPISCGPFGYVRKPVRKKIEVYSKGKWRKYDND